MAYRPDVDGLRAVAVAAVVAFHAFPAALPGGFVGVDVFFVISGFLISSIILADLERGTFTFGGFYARRARRIFPALAAVLLACLAFGWFALLADEYRQLGRHAAAGAGFVSNLVLRRESGYFDNAADTKPLLHLWSLGIEEQFYIAWPLLVWLAWRGRRPALAVAALAAVVAVASFAHGLRLAQSDIVGAFYSPLSRVWELAIGALLACAMRARPVGTGLAAPTPGGPVRPLPSVAGRTRDATSLLGACVLVAGFVAMSERLRFPGAWPLIPVIGAALLVAAGPAAWVNRRILARPLLVRIGLISYPLYLWHWPLLSFARIIDGATPPAGVRVAAVAASVLLAWLTFRWIEGPIRFGRPGGRRVAAVCAALAVVGTAGYFVKARDGLAQRAAVRQVQMNRDELVRTPAIDEACRRRIGIDRPPFPYCRFTDARADRTLAVIGDSHAHVAYPGIAELAAQRGQNTLMLANSGCPPLLGGEYGKTDAEREACRHQIERLLDIVASLDDVRQVVVFTRGPLYITGKGFGPAERDQDGAPMIPAERFAASLQRTVERLRGAGKQVFLVAENPELGLHPLACIDRPMRLRQRGCEVPLDIVRERQSGYRAVLAGITGATLLDPLPAFCGAATCSAMRDGVLMYADDDHLSVAGSRWQAQAVIAGPLGWTPGAGAPAPAGATR